MAARVPFIAFTSAICLWACAPSSQTIQTAIAETQVALPTETLALRPSVTPTTIQVISPTPAETPTNTLTPTETYTPTITPTSTITPTPTVTLPALTSAACIPTGTHRDVALVTSVIDGDTIRVNLGGTSYKVRYIGMDTPEQGDANSYEASLLNINLVSGETVTLVKDVSETDQYNRLLRYVIVGDIFVNYELVVQGVAVVDTFPPDVACADTFVDGQQSARNLGMGMWEPTRTPRPPSEPSSGGNCHPSYPTVCIPPPPPDLDCGDIPYRRFQVTGSDPHRFDADHDGIGCESG